MEQIGNDDIISQLHTIAEASYNETFENLFKKTKKELQNALSFIELQKGLITSARIAGIHSCLSEIRAARAISPRDCHVYFDVLIKTIEAKDCA